MGGGSKLINLNHINKMKKNKTLITVFLILTATISAVYLVRKNRQVEEPLFEQAPGQGPSKEDLEYMDARGEKCPIWELDSIEISSSVAITKYDCDFINTGGDLGEDVTVEIYTSDFEVGKQEFRDWLTEHGLEESEKLRVKYVHKP